MYSIDEVLNGWNDVRSCCTCVTDQHLNTTRRYNPWVYTLEYVVDNCFLSRENPELVDVFMVIKSPVLAVCTLTSILRSFQFKPLANADMLTTSWNKHRSVVLLIDQTFYFCTACSETFFFFTFLFNRNEILVSFFRYVFSFSFESQRFVFFFPFQFLIWSSAFS